MQKRHNMGLLLLVTVFLMLLVVVSPAVAMESRPGLEIMGNSTPTNLPPGGKGVVELYVYDLGAGSTSPGAVVTDTLPADLTPTGYTAIEGNGQYADGCGVQGREIKCDLTGSAELGGVNAKGFVKNEVDVINIDVTVSPNARGSETDSATVTGGGALKPADTTFLVTFGTTEPAAGFTHLDAWITNPDGTIDTQAGSHPYDLTIAFALNTIASGEIKEGLNQYGSFNGGFFSEDKSGPAGGRIRNLNVNLPPGIVGDPEAVPQCTRPELDGKNGGFGEGNCPADTRVGTNRTTVAGIQLGAVKPVYNMVPPPGVAAQFAINIDNNLVYLDAGVRTGWDNGITEHVDDVPENEVSFNTITIWGVPAEHQGSTTIGSKPLLTLPTSCQGPQEFTSEYLGTWENENYVGPGASVLTHDSEDHPVGFTGCERLQPFKPAISIAPDTTYADTPAGLSVDLKMPEGLNPEGLSAPGLQNTTVVLPEGVVINPGQATGLVACQPSQESLGSLPDGEVNEGPASCPSASKVGTDEISTPLLPNKLQGSVYILGQNPPDLQLLITASGEGINLKLVGNVHLNETTGQLTTTFEKTPDLPFTDFKLSFSGGAQAALATPTGCGTYQSTALFTPWASPFIENAMETSRFQITAGPNGTPCASPMPFNPTMTAGATTDQAGGYTGFTMLLQRGDEQQRIKTLSFKTPEGLLGMIAKVPLCPEAQANAGTCSSASQIGHTVVGAGPGPFPFYIPQASAPSAPIYLTGPYKGAPFGLSIVVPIIAGPFNLGTEIVRATINVDPRTSQITVTTNPLPVLVKGIPADLRSIDAVIDRPEFMFNPTSCNPMSFSGTATSIEGATAALSSHFQMGSCQALKFQPNFKVSTAGKTSRSNGASLTAKIVYPVGNLGSNQATSQSNIASVKVDLPKQLPSRLTTLQKACPAATFNANPANCPPDSVVGHAKVITPLLPVPVEGPAYFVSHAGEEFPNLILVLQGDNVKIELIGDTFINTKTNITSSTFKEVPDVPIQTFELNLPQGKYSALAANTNLCKSKLVMPTAFTGQNGAVIHQSTPVSTTGCAKAKPKRAKKGKKPSKGHKAKKR